MHRFARNLAYRLRRATTPEVILLRLALAFTLVFRRSEIRRHITGFVAPGSNEPLSHAEFERARAICGDIRALIAGRGRYVQENGLDSEFCLPGANWRGAWEKGALYRGTAALLREDYQTLNHLRLFCQCFSGYSLLDMRRARIGSLPPDCVPADLDERFSEAAGRLDYWVMRYWRLTRRLPEHLWVSQPGRFGEAGWWVDGRLANHDAYAGQERIALLQAAGQLERLRAARSPTVLEIGGGFGGLAYHLKRLLPQARYLIVDLPESLVFSCIYLSTLFPDDSNVLATSPDFISRSMDRPGFTFIPNHFCPRLRDREIRVDLAINTLSMSEMLESQVREYCSLIRRLITPDGAFFEQNQDNRHLGLLDVRSIVGTFFPARRRVTVPTGVVHGTASIWSM